MWTIKYGSVKRSTSLIKLLEKLHEDYILWLKKKIEIIFRRLSEAYSGFLRTPFS